MSRDLQTPSVDSFENVVAIEDGGTGVSVVTQAADSIGVIPLSQKNAPNGVAGLDSNSRISISALPLQTTVDWINVKGIFNLIIGNSYTFTITDFDSFKNYTVSCSNGVMTRINDVLSYTANSVVGSHTFTVNGRVFSFTIQAAGPQKPVITSPVLNATVATTSYTFTSSAFVELGDTATHLNSDWQLATDAAFTTIVASTSSDSTNKVSWTVASLATNTSYFVRVRHRATNNNASSYSDTISFSVISPVPVTPSITSPASGANTVSTTPNFTSSAFVALPDSSTHASSDWQLSTNVGFTAIVAQVTDSTTYKTNWSLSGLTDSTTYFLRVRYKSSNGNKSAYSPVITFSTAFVDRSPFNLNLTIATDQPSGFSTIDLAVANGWDHVRPLVMTITINTGVYVSSVIHSGSLPSGSDVTLINNGFIIGAGGGGGLGGTIYRYTNDNNFLNSSPGSSGATGLSIGTPINVRNNNLIAGGGGGGGGGSTGVYTKISTPPSAGLFGQSGGSGGGGQGYPAGSFASNLYNAGSYPAATINAPGQGLDGMALSDQYGSATAGLKGGDGGGLGTAGNPGTSGTTSSTGGPAGYAVNGNSYITWLATGTRTGGIIN